MQKFKDFVRQTGWKKITAGLVVLVVIFFCGFSIGRTTVSDEAQVANLVNKDATGTTTAVDFATFWKVWNIIDQKYVATNNIGTSTTATTTGIVSDQTRVYGAISGMVDSLGDPYTEFFPPVENKDFNDQINGNFGGVGMEVGETNGVLTVIAPLKDTPAYKAGVKSGDQIIQIDDTPTSSLSVDEAVNMIRGNIGTTVKLVLIRVGVKDPIKISIVRDTINIPTLDTKTVGAGGDIFDIELYNFSADSANLFRGALRDFVNSGDSKMIIDLRGNPGGYLDAAVDMASWFLPMGNVVVQEDYLNNTDNLIYRSKGYDIFNNNLKLVVLIDNGSASASEILAGALHDHGVATLVGVQSFGKGSVQELVDITPDTSLKVTVAKWLTPSGISISHEGLSPDVAVKLDTDQFAKGVDTQLNAAIQLLDK